MVYLILPSFVSTWVCAVSSNPSFLSTGVNMTESEEGVCSLDELHQAILEDIAVTLSSSNHVLMDSSDVEDVDSASSIGLLDENTAPGDDTEIGGIVGVEVTVPASETVMSEIIGTSQDEIHGHSEDDSPGTIDRGVKRKVGSKRKESKEKRMRGEIYVGFRRVDKAATNKIMHDVPKGGRKLGPKCVSQQCVKWSTRACNSVTEETREKLFEDFWKKIQSWEEKKMYISGLIDVKDIKQCTVVVEEDLIRRRSNSMYYHLNVGKDKVPVCKKMFLNTFDLRENTVRGWVLDYNGIKKNTEDQEKRKAANQENLDNNHEEGARGPNEIADHQIIVYGRSVKAMQLKWNHLRKFIDGFPKLPSHYCRTSSTKLYLQTDINSMGQFLRVYREKCKLDRYEPLGRYAFLKACKQKNVTIYKPRKDQCDLCCGYKVKNVSLSDYKRHHELKLKARAEKTLDKERALNNEIHTICCDLMAVQVVPMLHASAAYYKLKLTCHNFTVYNLATHDAKCYWFDESTASLDASTYATCLIDYIEELLSASKRQVIIYSDGCTAQNRNVILANALLHLSVKHGVTIIQKYLEKGHTQMEGDSVHGTIEKRMKNKEIYLPSQFSTLTKEARHSPFPYRSVYLDYDFANNYSLKESMVYTSIRPGNKKGDPQVTDLRWIQYLPTGRIQYKVNFDEQLQELPRRPLKLITCEEPFQFPKVNSQRRNIPLDKWKDLQDLKEMVPCDCHPFYNQLPHDETSIRQQKTAKKKIENP